MAIVPCTVDREERLEELMPEEELPSGSNVIKWIEDIEDLSLEQKNLITELFDDMEVAHDHLVRASGVLARLLRTLNGKQLLTVLKASVHCLVQINALEKFWKEPVTNQHKTDFQGIHTIG